MSGQGEEVDIIHTGTLYTIITHYILFTYFSKLLKLRFLTLHSVYLLTLGAHAHSEGYSSCRVCMDVCVCVCMCDHS